MGQLTGRPGRSLLFFVGSFFVCARSVCQVWTPPLCTYIHICMWVYGHKCIKIQTGMCGCSRTYLAKTHTHTHAYMCVPISLDAAAAHKRANFSVSVSFECVRVPLRVYAYLCVHVWRFMASARAFVGSQFPFCAIELKSLDPNKSVLNGRVVVFLISGA